MENKYRSLDDLPLVLRVADLMPILGIGRNTAYELVRCGQIRRYRNRRYERQVFDHRVTSAFFRDLCGIGHLRTLGGKDP